MSFYLRALRHGLVRIVTLPRFSLPILLTLSLTLAAVITALAISSNTLFQALPDIKNEQELYQVESFWQLSEEFTIPAAGEEQFTALKTHYQHLGDWGYFLAKSTTFSLNDSEYAAISITASRQSDRILGLTLLLGDNSDTADEQDGVWISHSLWRNYFNSNLNVLTQSVQINEKYYQIRGVLSDFTSHKLGDQHASQQIWHFPPPQSTAKSKTNIQSSDTVVFIRTTLAPPKETELNQFMTDLTKGEMFGNVGMNTKINLYRDNLTSQHKNLILMLLAVFTGLLVIACCNLLNAIVAHYQMRQHEFIMSLSLGASRFKLFLHITLELLPLFVVSFVLGLLCAAWLIQALPIIFGADFALLHQVHLDTYTVLMSGLFIVLIAALFASICMKKLNLKHIGSALNSSGKGFNHQSGHGLQKSLFVIQLCLSSVILTAISMVGFNSYQLLYPTLGFNFDNTLLIKAQYPQFDSQASAEQKFAQAQQIRADLIFAIEAHDPSLKVLQGSAVPLNSTVRMYMTKDELTNRDFTYYSRDLAPDFFQSFDMKLVAGRTITEQEWQDKAKVTVINESLARLLAPNKTALDIIDTELNGSRIIGIAADVYEIINTKIGFPTSYQSYRSFVSQDFELVIQQAKGKFDIDALNTVLLAQNPLITQLHFETQNQTWLQSTAKRRTLFYFTLALALLTLGLTAVGMAGLATSITEQRRYELAIRMATGATRQRLLGLIVNNALGLLATGLTFGAVAAVLVYQQMHIRISSLPEFAWLPMLAIDLLLISIVLIAMILPAQRIISQAPMQALRQL
ncbi:hypothetical protein PULV_a2376 [Pseudoalteromonas ulvae UL12]|uniref:Uncharacterized protein n=1 Tax=Pseudoalteromonas ulvae TaxID=107327 RepID=A0A2C9ZZL7_PSEDV|nr:ABC transporter permease [Pseudoalteromonas ulvae]MBE0364639.1 hypothetical protein [Pseudoalteromonas ulvae UL12]OUL56214.1 hypothetical protein B1199_19070 [Pseudoalteromonas ulvae]